MNKRPSTQFYPGDWWRAVDLRKCCMATQGCWFNMLLVMWDEKEQGKITGTKIEFCRVVGCDQSELQRFLDDAKKHHFADVTFCNNILTIINRRMHGAYIDRENTKQRVARHRAKEKQGGNTDVTPYSSTSSSTSSSKNPPNPPDWFEQFWKIYPRKVGKGKALESFQKLSPNSKLLAKILAAVEQQKKSIQWQKDDGQFIPMPATWLNQGRWEDELPITKTRTELLDEKRAAYKKVQES